MNEKILKGISQKHVRYKNKTLVVIFCDQIIIFIITNLYITNIFVDNTFHFFSCSLFIDNNNIASPIWLLQYMQ